MSAADAWHLSMIPGPVPRSTGSVGGRTEFSNDAVRIGGARAARPITVAGIVLALSFALLAIVPLRSFRELAVTMTLGLLLDAFLVRTVLVPALITLVGARGTWPGGGTASAPGAIRRGAGRDCHPDDRRRVGRAITPTPVQ